MSLEDRIWLLIAKKDNGDINPEELAELEWELHQNEAVKTTREFVEHVMDAGWKVTEYPLDADAHWEAIERQIQGEASASQYSKRVILKRILMAASVTLVLASGLFIFRIWYTGQKQGDAKGTNLNQVSMQLGSRSKIMLPDGTKVWLNGGSKLTYDDFSKAQVREVHLSGEAFFEVMHDKLHPFIVHTATVDIRDIGTSFVVKAYPDDKKFEATLIEGSIEVVDRQDAQRKILLKPLEKIVIPLTDSLIVLKSLGFDDNDANMLYKIDKVKKDVHGLMPETAWVENKLVFNNEPFDQLAKRMERWYDVSIHFRDTGLMEVPFSGIIEKETIDQALQAMQFSASFKYHMQGNVIWINKN